MRPFASRAFALALRAVPRAWRDMVRDDLRDQFGASAAADLRRSANALVIAASLHWEFTRGAATTDVRDAIRSLVRAKGFALGAIATFALGIGVNLAVFSAVDRMLFRPLPYADPDRLVVMGAFSVVDSQPYGTVPALSVEHLRQSPLVSNLAVSGWNTSNYRLTPALEGARPLRFVPVSYTTLATLGLHPIVGRDFTEEDARAKRDLVMVKAQVWRREFGARLDVLGRRVWGETKGADAEVIGVLPDDFFPPQVDPAALDWSGIVVDHTTFTNASPRDRETPPVVRLATGVSVEALQREVTSLNSTLGAATPFGPVAVPTAEFRLIPLRTALFGRYSTYLFLTFAAATLVLLVGCANLVSLLLVRGRAQERRSALQIALGASASRVIRASLVEALVLALAGAATAVFALRMSEKAIAAWLPPLFNSYAAPVLEPRVLWFTLLLVAASAVAAGVVPGWRAARVDVLTVLHKGTGRAGAGRLRGSAAILAAELGISLVLVACATLASRNLVSLLSTDLGYDPDGLVHVLAFLPSTPDRVRLRAEYGDELAALRAMPGVRSVAAADVLPIVGAVGNAMGDDGRLGYRYAVTDRFVETLGIRLLAGRSITAAEVASLAPVGVLSQSGARLLWPGIRPREAVGREMRLTDDVAREVIGVVSDVRGDYATPPLPSLYVPSGPKDFRFLDFAVRLAPGSSLSVTDLTRRLSAAGLTPTRVTVNPFAKNLAEGVANQRFRAELLSGFGLVALVLSMVGLYAVQSFNVAQRTTEFGVRLSLGATPGDLRGLLLRQTLAPACVGIGAGLVATFWLARYLQVLLDVVSARDPWTYASVAAALLLVALAATFIPARSAAKTDPVVALRAQ